MMEFNKVDDAQRDRFIETARKLSADTDAEALDRVFGKVVPPVVPKAPEKEDNEA